MKLVQLGGERLPAARARGEQREHPAAHRLQVRHPQPVGVDRRPGLTAGMGDEQPGPEGPAVVQVEEPDLAHPGRPGRRAGQRRRHADPGSAGVVGARDRGAVHGGAVARGAGLADHPAGVGADEGDRAGPEVSRHGRRERHRRGRGRRTTRCGRPGRRGGGRLPGLRGRRRVLAQHRQVDHLGDGHRRGHDHRRRGRGDGQPAVLAAPGPALDQLERARRRRERVDPLAQPGVEVVAAVSHRVPPAPSSAWPAPRTGRP